jgi:hypothetical protein
VIGAGDVIINGFAHHLAGDLEWTYLFFVLNELFY